MRRLVTLLIACATLPGVAQPLPADSLGEAVVTGTRGPASAASLPVTVTVVGRDALTAQERTSVLPTLSDLVPGLFVTQRGLLGYGVSDGAAGGINIRGMQSGSGRVMVLVNGHPQYQGIFGHAISDSYQTLGVERVEVVRGPASVLYGSNGMGGVVNLITRQAPAADGTRTDLHAAWGSYGTFEASAANRLRAGKFHSAVGLSYARTDGHRPRLDFEQYNAYAHLGYDFSSRWQANAMADVTYFIAQYPGTTSAPLLDAKQKITRGNASVSLDNDYGVTQGRVSLYHNWGDHKINDGHAPTAAPRANLFRSHDALTGLSAYQSLRPFAGHTLTLGFDWQRIRGEAWNRRISDGQRVGTSVDTVQHEVAGYVDLRQEFTPWLTAEAGLRLDHHSQTGTTLVPQGGVTLRLPHRAELRATVGKGFRNPTLRELYMWAPANADLKPERLVNYELSWSQRLADGRVRYGVNAYLLKADNLIQTAVIDGKPRNVNTGKATNYGLEAEAEWQVCGALSLATNHSLVHMRQPLLDTPRYKGYLGATLHTARLRATLGAQYVHGLYTAIGTAERRETFLLVNATAAYRLLPSVEVYAKADNLLARRYETRLGYPMPRATFMGGVNLNF